MKLHAVLICKKRLTELGWECKLQHQDECNEQTHWILNTNIPYRGHSWVSREGKRIGGVIYDNWKEWFSTRERFIRFLKRYYRHYVNFWIWEDLEDAIVFETDNIHRVLHAPQPYRNRRGW